MTGWIGKRLVVATAGPADAATRLVSTTGTNAGTCLTTPCKTITYALGQAAATGDTISVAAGTYPEAVAVTAKEVTISGAGAGSTIINPGGTSAAQKSALSTNPGTGKVVTASGLTLTGGFQATFSGGVNVFSGELKLSDSTVTGNTGGFGGGIGVFTNFAPNPKLTATNVTVQGNTASVVGGGIFDSGQLAVTGGTIDGNTAPRPRRATASTTPAAASSRSRPPRRTRPP